VNCETYRVLHTADTEGLTRGECGEHGRVRQVCTGDAESAGWVKGSGSFGSDLSGRDGLHRRIFGQSGLRLIWHRELSRSTSRRICVVVDIIHSRWSSSTCDSTDAGYDVCGKSSNHPSESEATRVVDDRATGRGYRDHLEEAVA